MVNKKKFKILEFSNTKIGKNERKVEAILFAAAEPLDTETIRARIGKALDVRGLMNIQYVIVGGSSYRSPRNNKAVTEDAFKRTLSFFKKHAK